MNEPVFVLGAAPGETLALALHRMRAAPSWAPFDDRAVQFVGRFSQLLLTHPAVRTHPELAALGHWFRPARLRDWAAAHAAQVPADTLWRGRGLAFHVAPANVDALFLYSWLISALAGNANIVRLSQQASAPVDLALEVLHTALSHEAGTPMRDRIIVLTYPHDDALTAAISAQVELRVVWGGDATVAALRAIPLRPTALELVFPDRFSCAALHAQAVLQADDAQLARLATAFYNDAFWFAQQACSSPRLVLWVGEPEAVAAAQAKFWREVQSQVDSRRPENTAAMAMARVVATCEYAALGARLATAGPASFPQRLQLPQALAGDWRQPHCGYGLFLEQRLGRLEDLAPRCDSRDQTLTVFGFSPQELRALVDALPPRAIDRIVAPGEALAFDAVWDGVDLLRAFGRQVRLPGAPARPS